jgi:hypothetical protein
VLTEQSPRALRYLRAFRMGFAAAVAADRAYRGADTEVQRRRALARFAGQIAPRA